MGAGFLDGFRRGQLQAELSDARARGDWQAADSIQAELAGSQRAPVAITPAAPCEMWQLTIAGQIKTCTKCGQSTQCF